MIYSVRGALLAVGFIAVVTVYTTVNRGMNYKAAKASVFLIDRECRFDRKSEGGKSESVTQSCNATDEFNSIAHAPDGKRKMDVDGKAVVKVSYTAPQDGSYQTSQLRFDGRDDEFYKLKAGDQIDVLVSNADPAKIIKG
jgi:hypothetical protein